jgi:hypothetical protein
MEINPFDFISELIVDNFCFSEDELRRQKIAKLSKRSGGAKRSFKIVNELIGLIQQEPFFKSVTNNYRLLT